jgi:hypothetical protein
VHTFADELVPSPFDGVIRYEVSDVDPSARPMEPGRAQTVIKYPIVIAYYEVALFTCSIAIDETLSVASTSII